MPQSRFRRSLLSLLGTWALATVSGADEPRLLEPGDSAERTLDSGEVQVYRISPSSGRPRKIVVRPRGIDVDVAVADRNGRELIVVGSPAGRYGAESLLVPRDAATVEVRAIPHRSDGAYRIDLEELSFESQGTEHGAQRLAAERAMTRAGELYFRNGGSKRQGAGPAYLEALERWRELGDRSQEVRSLFYLGALHNELGQAAQAREFLEQALPLWRFPDRLNAAATLNQLGYACAQEGDNDRAIEFYSRALTVRRQLGDVFGEALTLNNLGQVVSATGEPRKALGHLGEALALARRAQDALLVARLLNNLGGGYRYLGEMHEARGYFRQALDQQRVIGDRQLEAATLLNLGVTSRSLGEYHQALGHYQEALAILRQLGNRRREATALNNIGFAYLSLGELQRALGYFEQALPVRREVGDRRGEAATLLHLGSVWLRLEQPDKALELFRQALSLRRALGDRQGEAATLTRLADLEAQRGTPALALESLERALALRRQAGNRHQEAHVLRRIGQAHRALGDPRQALEFLRSALALHRAVKDASGEAATLAVIGRLEYLIGELASARQHLEAAIDLIEHQRARIVSPDLRASFLAENRAAYQDSVDLLMTLHRRDPAGGHDEAALYTHERAHARGLLDLLEETDTGAVRTSDPELVGERRRLLQRLSLKAERRSRLLSGQLDDDEAVIEQELSTILTELDVVEGRIRRQSPSYGELTQPRILRAAEIQRLLDDETLLLEYALGEPRSFLWAITADSVTSFVLPARGEIEAIARRLYEAWRTLDVRDGPAQAQLAAELSAMVLAPIADRLDDQCVVVVADGVLHYVAFAALPRPDPTGPGQPLLLRHEVVHLPSASVLAAQRRILSQRRPATAEVAVLADPVFDDHDPRVRTTGGAVSAAGIPRPPTQLWAAPPLARLPMTRREAQAITDLPLEGEVLLGLDFKASRELATSGILSRFRILHFATHGVLDSRHPALSGLMLSQVDAGGGKVRGFLGLRDVYNLRLSADLVILSGCQTALGKEIRGEGLVGLTRGFMYAGAARVLASLWRIQDKATAELMAAFYRALLSDDMPPAAALRRAQLAILARPGWQDPYYWAPFIVQGDWR